MIINYKGEGNVYSIVGYRDKLTDDNIHPIDGYKNYRIYDPVTIERVWKALDTGGTVQVELNENDEPIGVITENGDLEPTTPSPSPIEQLGIEVSQREINEIIHGRQISDIEIRLLMGGL